MNNKKEYTEKYGEAAYIALEKMRDATKRWVERHPNKVREASHEGSRKEGKYYRRCLTYNQTGLRGERSKIRIRDWKRWNRYKKIIAPDSQIHHSWRPGTSKYDGVALVEANQHMHGIIDIIQILEGRITLSTEEEIRNQMGE